MSEREGHDAVKAEEEARLAETLGLVRAALGEAEALHDDGVVEENAVAPGAALERIVVVEEFGSHGRTSSRTTRRLNTRSSQPDRMLTHSTAKQTLRSYVP